VERLPVWGSAAAHFIDLFIFGGCQKQNVGFGTHSP
jgi:hypothetical protein